MKQFLALVGAAVLGAVFSQIAVQAAYADHSPPWAQVLRTVEFVDAGGNARAMIEVGKDGRVHAIGLADLGASPVSTLPAPVTPSPSRMGVIPRQSIVGTANWATMSKQKWPRSFRTLALRCKPVTNWRFEQIQRRGARLPFISDSAPQLWSLRSSSSALRALSQPASSRNSSQFEDYRLFPPPPSSPNRTSSQRAARSTAASRCPQMPPPLPKAPVPGTMLPCCPPPLPCRPCPT